MRKADSHVLEDVAEPTAPIGFACPRAGQRHRRDGLLLLLQITASLVLAISTIVAATVFSIGHVRAKPLGDPAGTELVLRSHGSSAPLKRLAARVAHPDRRIR